MQALIHLWLEEIIVPVDDQRNKWDRADTNQDLYSDYSLLRLINQAGEAEGANLMPRIVRGIRVQPANGFSIVRQEELKYATRFILRWTPNYEMAALGARYRIYTYAQQNVMPMASNQSRSTVGWNGPLLSDVMADGSPAEVIVRGFQRQPVVFEIETRLPNGFVALEETRPSCSGICNPVYSRVVTVSAAYTALMGDETILANSTGGNFAVTLFDCRQLPVGFTYTLKKLVAANTVTWTPFSSGQTIDGATSIASTTQYEVFNIRTDGTVWHKA